MVVETNTDSSAEQSTVPAVEVPNNASFESSPVMESVESLGDPQEQSRQVEKLTEDREMEQTTVEESSAPTPTEVEAEQRTPETSAAAEVAANDDAIEPPKFLFTAMEKVATNEGFTPGAFKIEFDVGSNKGDGFVGQMFKAFLSEGDRREEYLCKIPPLNEARRRQFETMAIFTRETLAYKTLLPTIFAHQEEKGIRREEGFFNTPKCYHAECDEQTEESVIIMEDLRLQDYRMWNKLVPVNYDHARLTMEQLGRLHAVSFALKRDRPEEFEQFKVPDPLSIMMPEGGPFDAMMQQMIADATETLEPHETKEREKMQKLRENFRQEMKNCANSGLTESHAVLSHGDCWVNNFMFHYKDGSPDRVVLLDWQITRYVSPAMDLAYFIFCCTDGEFRRRHYDEMINIYYNALATLLEQLGHDPQQEFPRTALIRQLRRYGRFGILMAVFLVPMMCTRNEDLPDMDAAAEKYRDTKEMDANPFSQSTSNNVYRKRMGAVIRDLVQYGYL